MRWPGRGGYLATIRRRTSYEGGSANSITFYYFDWRFVTFTEQVLRRRSQLAKALQSAEAERQALGSAANAYEAGDRSVFPLLLDAEVGKSVLTCGKELAGRFLHCYLLIAYRKRSWRTSWH